jgi:sialic acid synthase SpsE
LYFSKDIKKGEVITKDHIRSIRPGYGLPPKYLNKIVGKIAPLDIVRGTAVEERHV